MQEFLGGVYYKKRKSKLEIVFIVLLLINLIMIGLVYEQSIKEEKRCNKFDIKLIK
jgi:hypothetical protein